MSDTVHAPGTFCWAELCTSDAPGAKSFYTELMEWKTLDDPVPGGGVYTMLQLQGGNVGALYELTPEMKSQGVPPSWLSYITVQDAAATVEKAKELGGVAIKEAFDVLDIGTMAVLQDPTGATFAVWQPRKHHGTVHTDGKPGSVCWNELMTKNVDRAGKFYADLFHWEPTIKEMGSKKYTVFVKGEAPVAGMDDLPEDGGDVPSHWMVNFAVSNCEASVERAMRLGGKVMVPTTEIPPVGKFSVIQDPQGAAFGMVQMERPS